MTVSVIVLYFTVFPTVLRYVVNALFEEIVEDWKLQSDVGERVLMQLSSMLPSIHTIDSADMPSLSNSKKGGNYSDNLHYSSFANSVEDQFSILSKCIDNFKIYVVEMEDVIKQSNKLLQKCSVNQSCIENILLYRGESSYKCSLSDWHTIIMAEYGMIKQDINMKCDIFEKIVHNKLIKQNELTLLNIKWKTKPFIDNNVFNEINHLVKLDHMIS